MYSLREDWDPQRGWVADIVDKDGNVLVGDFTREMKTLDSGEGPTVQILGDYEKVKYVDSGEGTSFYKVLPLPDVNELNRQYELKKNQPFGAGEGPALGYEYGVRNENGDIYRKYDAQGNLTEYLDKDLKWQKTSEFKPKGVDFDEDRGELVTYYDSPVGVKRDYQSATINKWAIDKGGFLGPGGWQALASMAVALASAGLAAPAVGAIQGATGLGSLGASALYGGGVGALSGAITGGAQGALQGGLLGAAGGAASSLLSGSGAQAMPVDVGGGDFSGFNVGDAATWGMGEFQPFAGGDVGLGSGMVTQFLPDGSYVTLTPGGDYTYTVEDQGTRVLTPEEVENLMRNDILPADMQIPAEPTLSQRINSIFPEGITGDIIKGGLALGGLSVLDAVMPKQGQQASGTGGFTAAELQALVSAMPSAINQYIGMANQAGATAPVSGYPQSATLAQLFPGFSLPTTGEYGAGRFGAGYAPAAPTIGLV